MKNSELAFVIREFVRVDRKPSSLNNLSQTIEDKLPENIKTYLNNLQVLEVDEYFNTFDDNFDGDQQIYLLKHEDGRKFFVDTQGYTYARYIGELI
jgi:hypothetical protein